MGLDWMPGARPLPGAEVEFEKLFRQIKTCSEKELGALKDRLDAISSFVPDVLKAPRIGVDPEANEYLRQIYEQENREESFESWLESEHGKPVWELAEGCDGIPRYSNAGLYEHVNFTSFRANFLKDCVDIIGEDLLEQAFEMMNAQELCKYGDALAAKANTYADKKGIDLASIDWERRDDDPIIWNLDVVLCASIYCLFWGRHGIFMHAWY